MIQMDLRTNNTIATTSIILSLPALLIWLAVSLLSFGFRSDILQGFSIFTNLPEIAQVTIWAGFPAISIILGTISYKIGAKKKDYIYAVGRRRTAAARVRLFKGRKDNLVNGVKIDEYFPGLISKTVWTRPFKLTDTEGKYYVTVKVVGGGKRGQLGAVIHGISRALSSADVDKFRAPLKKEGLLTRDPRTRERRKVGTGGKARRKKQSPKR